MSKKLRALQEMNQPAIIFEGRMPVTGLTDNSFT
jgi:hypothetical protein